MQNRDDDWMPRSVLFISDEEGLFDFGDQFEPLGNAVVSSPPQREITYDSDSTAMTARDDVSN